MNARLHLGTLAQFIHKRCKNLKNNISDSTDQTKLRISMLTCYGAKGMHGNLTRSQAYCLYGYLQHNFNIPCSVAARVTPVVRNLYPERPKYTKGFENSKIGSKITFTQRDSKDIFYYDYTDTTLSGYIINVMCEKIAMAICKTTIQEKKDYLKNLFDQEISPIAHQLSRYPEISESNFHTAPPFTTQHRKFYAKPEQKLYSIQYPAQITRDHTVKLIEILNTAKEHPIINQHSNTFTAALGTKTRSRKIIESFIEDIKSQFIG